LTLAVIVAIGWYAVSKRSRPDDAVAPVTAGPVRDLMSIEEYRPVAPPSPGRVVFIGLDGATWDVIDPMIENGLLPAFERLKREGSYGALRSVECYFSPPAWTTMMTGYVPERTGIYTFGKWNPQAAEFVAFSSLDVEVPWIWDIASAAGRRVGVTNVPLTYPARPVNGIMVSGLMTPIIYREQDTRRVVRFGPMEGAFDAELDGRSFSPPLVSRTVISVNTFALALYDTIDDDTQRYDAIALKVYPSQGATGDSVPTVRFKPNEYSRFFQMDYRIKEDERRVMRRVACSVIVEHDGDPRTPGVLTTTPLMRLPSDSDLEMTYPDSVASEIEKTFGYYLISMTHTPGMIPQGTEWTAEFASYFYGYDDWDLFFYVFQAPDNAHHGDTDGENVRAAYQSIDRFLSRLIAQLPDDATLVLASDHGFAPYRYIISLNDYFADIGVLSDPQRIDFNQTLVFHNQWCLYFNKNLLTYDALRRRGIEMADGQTPRQALVEYLTSRCKEIKLGDRAMPVELVDVPEGAVGEAPDMMVRGSYTDYFVEGDDIDIVRPGVVRPAAPDPTWYHSRDGMYLFWGNQTKPGFDGGEKNIADIAPSLLYLLDLPLSKDFDGRLMENIVRPEVLASKPRFTIADYRTHLPEKDYTAEQLQTLEETLRTLGYVR
jgi:predicted AlkP superfamily phosphohydrolase/phosphomutase